MKIREIIEKLKTFENQEANLFLLFKDDMDDITYQFDEDTSKNGYIHLLVNGYFEPCYDDYTQIDVPCCYPYEKM